MDFFESEKPFLDDLIVTNGYYYKSQETECLTDEGGTFSQRNQFVEEPWLLQPCGNFDYDDDFPHVHSINSDEDSKSFPSVYSELQSSTNDRRYGSNSVIESDNIYNHVDGDFISTWAFSERDHPVEDPWLLYPVLIPSETSACSAAGAPISRERSHVDKTHLELQEQHHQISEKLLSGTESNLLPISASVSTEILINCSICTMQRIAVLEDGNLVELLLEPVKSNVQCDSVYLGVVTKLVPHMGGAFVNIGSSRPSLMDIKHNKEPFIFPVFGGSSNENDETCSPSFVLEKNLDVTKLKQAFLEGDDELSDDDAELDFEDDELEEHENEDYMDLEDVKTGNVTGDNIVPYQLNGNGRHSKVQTDSHLAQRRTSTNNIHSAEETWALVRKGTKILVQVVKEGLGTKGPTLTAYPKLRSRFWVRTIKFLPQVSRC